MIQLIGPGGAGKSTAAVLLAKRLRLSFFDLDSHLADQVGDISAYIDRCGYEAYARENVAAYSSLLKTDVLPGVVALSSGFMSYPAAIHPEYSRVRSDIEWSPTTFVLLPSTDLETCVAETVRRQVGRVFGRSPAREEAVIRTRFVLYMAVPARKIHTMRPPYEVVDEIVSVLVPGTPRET